MTPNSNDPFSFSQDTKFNARPVGSSLDHVIAQQLSPSGTPLFMRVGNSGGTNGESPAVEHLLPEGRKRRAGGPGRHLPRPRHAGARLQHADRAVWLGPHDACHLRGDARQAGHQSCQGRSRVARAVRHERGRQEQAGGLEGAGQRHRQHDDVEPVHVGPAHQPGRHRRQHQRREQRIQRTPVRTCSPSRSRPISTVRTCIR